MEKITFALEILGTIAFAISGAVMAIKKQTDIFGVLFLAVTTASGGGMLRDIIIGETPPSIFMNSIFVIISLVTASLVFVSARIWGNSFDLKTRKIDRINNIFDALGLGVFTIMGINTAFAAGYGDNRFMVVFLGMITGVGGGIIRDIFINEIPSVLRKQVYAVASLIGGVLYYEMMVMGGNPVWCACVGIGSIFAIRLMATIYNWNLPRAITYTQDGL